MTADAIKVRNGLCELGMWHRGATGWMVRNVPPETGPLWCDEEYEAAKVLLKSPEVYAALAAREAEERTRFVEEFTQEFGYDPTPEVVTGLFDPSEVGPDESQEPGDARGPSDEELERRWQEEELAAAARGA